MRTYFLILLSVLFCSSCKKDKHYDRSYISISNKSNIGCDSVYVYVNIYNGYINDSLIIGQIPHNDSISVIWDNIKTSGTDGHFVFKAFMHDNKILNKVGGRFSEFEYSKVPSKMNLTIYADSIKIVSE